MQFSSIAHNIGWLCARYRILLINSSKFILMLNSKKKADTTFKSGNGTKPIVSSSAALKQLRKELKAAKAEHEELEAELWWLEGKCYSVEDKIEKLQKQIKELKSNGIAVRAGIVVQKFNT